MRQTTGHAVSLYLMGYHQWPAGCLKWMQSSKGHNNTMSSPIPTPWWLPFPLQGLRLLSAGIDKGFRLFSTIQDQQSRELSQKNVKARAKKSKVSEDEIKLPRVTQLAACEVRMGMLAAAAAAGGGSSSSSSAICVACVEELLLLLASGGGYVLIQATHQP